MKRIVKIDVVRRAMAMVLAIVMGVSVLPLSTFAADYVSPTLETTIEDATFTVDQAAEFNVKLTKNNGSGRVKGYLAFSDSDAVSEIRYKTPTGNWTNITTSGSFGGLTGFNITDKEYVFSIKFNKAGIYTVDMYFKTVSLSGGEVVCSVSNTVEVGIADISDDLSFDFGEGSFAVGKEKEFSFTYNGSKLVTADAYFEIIAPEVLNNDTAYTLGYKKVANSEDWTAIEMTGDKEKKVGYTGTTRGYTKGVEVKLNAKFNKEGKYTIYVALKNADNEVVCYKTATITVKKYTDITLTHNKIETEFDIGLFSNFVTNRVDGGEYTYVSDNTDVVDFANGDATTGQFRLKGVGVATVTVTLAENEEYVSSTTQFTVTVTEGTPQGELEWEKTIPSSITWKETFTNTIKGADAGTVTYAIKEGTDTMTKDGETKYIAEVDPSTGLVTFSKPGKVIVEATKKAPNYKDQTAEYTLNVVKAQQKELVFAESNPNAIRVNDTYQNIATGGTSTKDITYISSDPSVATVDKDGNVKALRVPNGQEDVVVTITATRDANSYYEEVTGSYQITIRRAPQKTPIVFEKGNATIVYGDDTFANAATGGDVGSIIYSSSDKSVATVDKDGKITTHKAGKVTITATAPETEQYEAISVFYELVIERAEYPNFKFDKNPTEIPTLVYGQTFENKASADVKATVTYSFKDEAHYEIAEIGSNGTVIPKGIGTVIVVATAAESDRYNEATIEYEITIIKANQNVSFKDANPVVKFTDNGQEFSNTATTDAEGNTDGITATYSIVSGENCVDEFDVSTGKFIIRRAGTVVVKVVFTGNDCYNGAEAEYMLKIEPSDQTIAFDEDEYTMLNGDKNFVAPTISEIYGKGNGKITYSIKNNDDGVVKENGIDPETGALTFTNKTGKVVILATKAADNNYNSATAEYTLYVEDAKLDKDKAYCKLVGDQLDEKSEWYTGNVSIEAIEGFYVSYEKEADKADWQAVLTDAVTEDGEQKVTFYVREIESGIIYEAQTATAYKDTDYPTASIVNEKLTGWDKFLSIITLGIWEPEQMKYTVTYGDSTSGVKEPIEYLVVEGSAEVLSDEELDTLDGWKNYTENGIYVDKDKTFVVYARVTDNAGHYVYATTNGVVFDRTAPTGQIVVETPDADGFYNSDVALNVIVDDADPSSGIKSVTYEIKSATVSETGTLYTFDMENPTLEDLQSHLELALTVDSSKFNSDDVKVTVFVTDNAGNTNEKEISNTIDICTDKPELLEFEYVDGLEAVDTKDGISYFNGARKVKIVIKERASIFAKTVEDNFVIDVLQSKGDSESKVTYKVLEWISEEITLDGQAIHTLYVEFNGDANYEYTVRYTDVFGNVVSRDSDKFAVDHEKPTATITIAKDYTWGKLLEVLTFGLWSNESVTVKAEADDATSPIKKTEMYWTDSTDIKTFDELEALYNDNKFEDYAERTVNEDRKFVIYIRVEDFAGHYDYFCSDGVVVDMNGSEIALTPERSDIYHTQKDEEGNEINVPVYNGDVNVDIKINEMIDGAEYSGIKTVEYWVTCDGVETIRKTLYSYEYVRDEGTNSNGGHLVVKELNDEGELVTIVDETGPVPAYKDLKHDFAKTVTIDSANNNSCNVVLYVEVTDNAGNISDASVKVDIDIAAPVIKVEYDNNNPAKKVGERGYYSGSRTATITITERSEHFNPENAIKGIKVKALDANDNPIVSSDVVDGYVEDISELFGEIEWVSAKGNTPDEDTHTLVLTYGRNANYTFGISYADLANNGNNGVNTDGQKTPYEFTVDIDAPEASVTVADTTWNKLLEVLTFGLYSKVDVEVSVSVAPSDATSPIESIEYYKTNSTELLNKDDLNAVTEWTDITADPKFTISEDERFVVYLKVTDYAGNCVFVNSDGYVVDKTDALIDFTLEDTDLYHTQKNDKGEDVDIPLYTGDVNVLINVTEKMDEAYSGIKQIKYWVTCNGDVTQPEEVLFAFDNASPKYEDLVHKFSQTVTIESAKNNGCEVILHVNVVDNAGNDITESIQVDIDITAPKINVEFDNNNAYKVVDEKGYFPNARRATVVITERPEHFNANKATESINISAIDAKGAVVENAALVGEWKTEGSGNNATHTAVIEFTTDANYEFTLSYTDLATLECTYEQVKFADNTVAPRYFAVDQTAPTGTVTVGELGTWDMLIEILTFGLWSKDTVEVSSTADDATAPIESVSYYKTFDTEIKTKEDLEKVKSWTSFDESLYVAPNERFVVYVKIVDYAGNVTFISTSGVIVDDTIPGIKPEITLTVPQNDIYSSDVKVDVTVTDPKVGNAEIFAGLKEIRYEVKNLGAITDEDTLFTFSNPSPEHKDLVPEWTQTGAITVDSNLNNSNDVEIIVYAVDNAGNKSEEHLNIMIDITAPTIDVSYNNNNSDETFGDHFKADRTATIVVTERNFDSEAFKYTVTNTDGYVPVISAWETKEGTSANGDDTTHTATILFDKDGDYTFEINEWADKAGNAHEEADFGDSVEPNAFTIDKTSPVVRVTYDNNDVVNGNYYKAQRIATITVTEHNFDASRVNVSLRATDNGVVSVAPALSNWTSRGDVHTATITYANDSLYVFDFDYIDKAGNASADMAAQTFYVDKTKPVLTIEKIVDESANNNEGEIGFVMTATDTNFDVFEPVLTAVVKKDGSFETKTIEIGKVTDIKNGKVYTVTNIEADGIYRITCTIVDKAGNAYSEVNLEKADGTKYVEQRAGETDLVTFSVNREGSAFEIDKNTAELIEKYYVQNVTNDVVIVEINADLLKENNVTLNGKTLEKDKDYTISEDGGNGSWMKYTYTVNKELFAEEGEYKLVVSSKDKAENDAFSDVKDATVAFVVDRTAPVVTVSGIEENGRYQTDRQTVTLIPTDDGGALKSLIVNLVDEDGKVIKEVINLIGEDFITALENNDGKITFEIAENLYQNIQIICTDCATGETEATNTHDATVKNVSVSSSTFMIFWANKALRWGTIGGISAVLIALVLFFIFKNKKRKEAK